MKQTGPTVKSDRINIGFLYSRHGADYVPGSLYDVRNMAPRGEFWDVRDGTERAYGAGGLYLLKRAVHQAATYLTTGHYLVMQVHADGSWSYYEGYDPAGATTNVALLTGTSTNGSVLAIRDTVYILNGATRPIRFIPSWPGGGTARYQYAGCFAPLDDPGDAAIGYAVEAGGPGGLSAGVYWLSETLLYGEGGRYGESRVGAVTRVVVPPELDGTARIVSSGTGLPARGSTYIPTPDPRYDNAWGRRFRRTKSEANGGTRNGAYYFLQDKPDMTTTAFETYVPDTALSADRIAVKYADEDEMLPPIATFIEVHGGYVVFGQPDPNRAWRCRLNPQSGDAQPDRVHPVDDMTALLGDPDDPMTGLASVQGQLTCFTENYAYEVTVVGGIGNRRTAGLGLLAPKSLARVRNVETGMVELLMGMTDEGPMAFDGSFWRPLGSREQHESIRQYLGDFCLNPRLCEAVYHDGQYIMSYPDARDAMSTDQVCTRQLIWNDREAVWTIQTELGMSCMVSEERRLLYIDQRHASRTYVMQQHGGLDKDFDTVALADQAIPWYATYGDLSRVNGLQMAVPVEARIRYHAPVRADAVYPEVTVTVDGTAGTPKQLASSSSDRPAIARVPLPNRASRQILVSIGKTTDVGRGGVGACEIEIGRRTL